MSRDEIAIKSAEATELFVGTSEYKRSDVIMVFLSLPSEIDTTPLVLRAWQDHKRVVAPRVSWEQRRMAPTEIRSLTSDLVESKMGLREPIAGLPIPVSIIDMVVVPGLVFDMEGNRLGRGRGFYDRFLAHPEFEGGDLRFRIRSSTAGKGPDRPSGFAHVNAGNREEGSPFQAELIAILLYRQKQRGSGLLNEK